MKGRLVLKRMNGVGIMRSLLFFIVIYGVMMVVISARAQQPTEVKTFARFVPERADDFAWENDKVAFRVYGPAMRNRTEDSGIDCWLKRVDYAIIDKWYLGNVNKKSYHRDHGEGYDPYHVGASRGCGGLGVWINDSIITSNTYVDWQIIKSEIEETIFVLTYEWNYDGDSFKEEKQISIKLGDRMFNVVSTFWKNGKIAKDLPIAIGVATHDGKASISKNLDDGWMACWEKIDDYGLGTGVVIDPSRIECFKSINTKAKDDGHALFITSTNKLGKVEYSAGYGWEKAEEIKTSEDWNAYLKHKATTNFCLPEEIANRMEKAADWQIDHPVKYGDLEWHCAPFYTGLTDLYEVTGNRKYLEYVKSIGDKNDWKIRDRKYHADDHAVGLAYIKLYQHYNDPKMIAAIQKELDWILANPPEHYITGTDGKVRLRYNRERWNWSDALYMAPPVWAALGAVTGESKYFDYLVQEWKQAHEWYWSESDSLYFHDKRDIVKLSTGGKKVFWARGDGWVVAGLVEVLQSLPSDHPERVYFEGIFKKMAAKLLAIQKENGIWAPNLLDPNDPPQDDISGSVFFVYGLAWGINNGLLNRSEYEAATRNGWQALCERQKENGRLINVQPVGGFPVAFDPENTEIFTVGGFISAGAEIWKMEQ